MTRRESRSAVLATIAGALMLLAAPCRAAGPYPPSSEPDLSRLVFAPSLVVDAVPQPQSRARARDGAGVVTHHEDRARTDSAITAQLDAIHEIEERDGFFSPDLVDEILYLAALYQDRGEHDVALTLLDRARQIVRFNEGLFSLDQAPMIRRATESRVALKEHGALMQTQSELLALAHRNPDDSRVAEIYNDVANSRMEDVERYFSGGDSSALLENGLTKGGAIAPTTPYTMATISSGSVDTSYTDPAYASNASGFLYVGPAYVDLPTITQLAWGALRSARRNYNEAIYAALRNPSADGPSVQDLEGGLVKTYYLEAQNLRRLLPFQSSPAPQRELLHELGANSYVRRLQHSQERRSPATELAAELLELGDWHLVFGHKDLAFQAYLSARDMLVNDGATTGQVTAFFSPSAPVVLPTFAAGWVDAAETVDYQGYVGVAIALDGAGKSTRVDVTERSVAATDAIVQKLKKHVAKSVFRPRFENGEWVRADHVSLRYYFSY